MQTIQQQEADARAACNAYFQSIFGTTDDYWETQTPCYQNAWHRVVEMIKQLYGM